MAYRVKGFLTKKQREDIGSFIRGYHAARRSLEADVASKELIEAVFGAWCILMTCILYADDCAILNRIVAHS